MCHLVENEENQSVINVPPADRDDEPLYEPWRAYVCIAFLMEKTEGALK